MVNFFQIGPPQLSAKLHYDVHPSSSEHLLVFTNTSTDLEMLIARWLEH